MYNNNLLILASSLIVNSNLNLPRSRKSSYRISHLSFLLKASHTVMSIFYLYSASSSSSFKNFNLDMKIIKKKYLVQKYTFKLLFYKMRVWLIYAWIWCIWNVFENVFSNSKSKFDFSQLWKSTAQDERINPQFLRPSKFRNLTFQE